MKYIILIGDGMADYPLKELGGKTPLMVAKTPFMDHLAKKGEAGMVKTVPENMHPGSDVANLSIFGYNPKEVYTGRAPLEAASMGITLKSNEWAFRCNLVTISNLNSHLIMQDYSSDHISSQEAKELIITINNFLGSKSIQFYPGVSYRHLMVYRGDIDEISTTPPHDITGKEIDPFLPKGKNGEIFSLLIEKSRKILESHPVNIRRKKENKGIANSIWLWGEGKSPKLLPITKKYHITGGVISAVDLIKGIGVYAGLKVKNVPGATGFLDTNYKGKVEAAFEILKDMDFVFLHVEAPDEAGHIGDINAKIKAIEDFDSKIVGPILKKVKMFKDYKILVMPDHPTPISTRTHASDPVPFVIYSANKSLKSNVDGFNESIKEKSNIFFYDGYRLMDHFILEEI